MAKTVEYEGYTIESAPHHLVEDETWRLCIFISVEDDRGVRTRERWHAPGRQTPR